MIVHTVTIIARLFNALLIFSFAGLAFSDEKSDLGKISGLAFGDLYGVPSHHDPDIKGFSGFQFRRINLTYDKALDAMFNIRFRLEAASPGDFSSDDTLQPFVKDLYLQYVGTKGIKVALGLIPTPTWSWHEENLYNREVEKSPLDLYRMGDSRDQGVSVQGKDSSGRALYHLMVGNGSGTKGKSHKGNTLYGLAGYRIASNLTVTGYADRWVKEGGVTWRTISASVVFNGAKVNAGVLVANQRRESNSAATVDLDLTSVFADYKLSPTVTPFVRVDVVNDAVPGADRISYLSLSPDGKPTLFMLGVDFKLGEHVNLIPTIEHFTYRRIGSTPKPSNDTFIKLTYFFRF